LAKAAAGDGDLEKGPVHRPISCTGCKAITRGFSLQFHGYQNLKALIYHSSLLAEQKIALKSLKQYKSL
jgi:hypothetical protein